MDKPCSYNYYPSGSEVYIRCACGVISPIFEQTEDGWFDLIQWANAHTKLNQKPREETRRVA